MIRAATVLFMSALAATLSSLWSFDDPAASEARFRALAAERVAAGARAEALEVDTQVARALGLQGRFDEALAVLDHVDAELRPGDVDARIRARLERGRVLNSSGHPEASRRLFVDAWVDGEAHGREALAIDAAHMLAIVESPERALEWTEKGIAAAERSEDPAARRWLGPLHHNLGMSRLDAGDAAGALESFQAALAARRDAGDPETIRIARWAVAHAERKLGRVDAALAEQRALETEMRDQGLPPDGFVLEEIAECLYAGGDSEAARPYFRQAHELLAEMSWLAESEPGRLERLERLAR